MDEKKVRKSLRVLIAYAVALGVIVLLFAGPLPVRMYVIYGTSMEPTLRSFDVVLAVSPEIRKPCVGDIAIVEVNGKRLAHRIVYMEDGRIITKGDNMRFPDPPAQKLYGVVVAIIPREVGIGSAAVVTALVFFRNRFMVGVTAPVWFVFVGSLVLATALAPGLTPISTILPGQVGDISPLLKLPMEVAFNVTVSGHPTAVRCSVEGRAVPTMWSAVWMGSLAIVEVRVSLEPVKYLVATLPHSTLECSVDYYNGTDTYRYTFRISYTPTPRFEPGVAMNGTHLIMYVNKTPQSLPVRIRALIIGCGREPVNVTGWVEPSKPLVVECRPGTNVRAVRVVAVYEFLGKKLVRGFYIEIKR